MPKVDIPPMETRRLLQALDRSIGLRAMLETRHPEAMRMAASFRKRVGDNCNYVRFALQKVWWDEWEQNREQFTQHLRSAGYDLGPRSGAEALDAG